MAGSYKMLVGPDGKFTFELIEDMGDAHEACEECFELIRQLKARVKELEENAGRWQQTTPDD